MGASSSSPAMSQIISQTSSPFTSRGFLSTLTPTVVWYLSENSLRTKRATRLVLPTLKEPRRQIFFLRSMRRHDEYNGWGGVRGGFYKTKSGTCGGGEWRA